MSYTCYQHGWSDEHLPCPQCQPHIVSTATTNTEHQSNHTPEQRGVDANYRANFLWGFSDDSIEMIGYEFANGKTEEYLKVCWDALLDKVKSTSEPLPSKGHEGEAERKAREIYDKCYHEIEEATAGLFEEDVPYIEARKKAAKATALICVDREIDLVDRLLNSRLNNDFDLLAERGELYKVRTIIVNL